MSEDWKKPGVKFWVRVTGAVLLAYPLFWCLASHLYVKLGR